MPGKQGFRVPRREAHITFEDSDYAGAEIQCALDVDFETFFWFQKRQASEEPDEIKEALCRFADQIIQSWNLEDNDGTPLPADSAGFLKLPPAFGLLILAKWTEAVSTVSAPLGAPSSDGDTLEAESVKMGAS